MYRAERPRQAQDVARRPALLEVAATARERKNHHPGSLPTIPSVYFLISRWRGFPHGRIVRSVRAASLVHSGKWIGVTAPGSSTNMFVNNLLAKDLPYLQLTYFNNYSISGANVKGIVPVPDGLIRVRDVWKER